MQLRFDFKDELDLEFLKKRLLLHPIDTDFNIFLKDFMMFMLIFTHY